MYVFDLDMSNIKSEVLTQERSKRKVFLKVLQNSLENNCAEAPFIMKVQAAWLSQTFTFIFYWAQVFSSAICEIFRTPLRTPTIL